MALKTPTRKKKLKKASDTEATTSLFNQYAADDIGSMAVNLHGPPGSGKTFSAVSVSEKWPATLPTKATKKIVLDDVAVIAFDRSALVGLVERGIKVPLSIDVSRMLGEHSVITACRMVLDAVDEEIAKGNVKYIIHDTITQLDKFIVAHWSDPKRMPQTSRGDDDSRAMYRHVLQTHMSYLNTAQQLNAMNIYNFHSRVLEAPTQGSEDQKRAAKEKQSLVKLDSNTLIVPEITGQAINAYTANASLEFACMRKKHAMKKGEMKFTIHPYGKDGHRGKSRFHLTVNETEDNNLGEILRRLQKL